MLNIVAFWPGTQFIDIQDLPEEVGNHTNTAYELYNPTGKSLVEQMIDDGTISEAGQYIVEMGDGGTATDVKKYVRNGIDI
ncbi:MAG TPA: hypothetical protein PLN81_05450 [Bacillota bacterium]|jgi:hypothetical protein|nr:hypothetical protein [Bacillota bacterium]